MQSLKCALCMYVRRSARDADVIINGISTCMGHAGFVSGGMFSIYLGALQEDVRASTGGRTVEDWDVEYG